MCGNLDLRPAVPHRPLPWMLRLEHLLFGRWEWVDDSTVRCIYCGTTNVSCKSRQPRLKRYVDEHRVPQTVDVYRFYCHNPACEHKSFTNLSPNLIPHSMRAIISLPPTMPLSKSFASLPSTRRPFTVSRTSSPLASIWLSLKRFIVSFHFPMMLNHESGANALSNWLAMRCSNCP